jgi:hypothetical protein
MKHGSKTRNRSQQSKALRNAIAAACDEIALVSISFHGDKKSWRKIIARCLRQPLQPFNASTLQRSPKCLT